MNYIYITASFYMMLVLTMLAGQKVYALPLMNTDDAGIVERGHCQIELDQRHYDDQSSEVNLGPACNVLNFELGLPLAWDDGDSSYAIQVKKELFVSEALPVAVAGSVQWQPRQNNEAENWELNLPVTITAIDKFQFDLNVGMTREDHHNEMTWGVASTYDLHDKHQISLEFFKLEPSRARTQAVYHYHVVPDNLSLYAAYGHPLQSDDQSWFGVGLSWVTPFR